MNGIIVADLDEQVDELRSRLAALGNYPMELEQLHDRISDLETTVNDWASFINQLRMTLAQLAMNPMVSTLMNPAQKKMLSQFLPPEV